MNISFITRPMTPIGVSSRDGPTRCSTTSPRNFSLQRSNIKYFWKLFDFCFEVIQKLILRYYFFCCSTVYGVIYVFYFLLPTLIHNIYANNFNGVLITMSMPLATFIFYSTHKWFYVASNFSECLSMSLSEILSVTDSM